MKGGSGDSPTHEIIQRINGKVGQRCPLTQHVRYVLKYTSGTGDALRQASAAVGLSADAACLIQSCFSPNKYKKVG